MEILLVISLDGVLVIIFVSHSFSCFNDLKLGKTIIITPRMVSFYFVFDKLSDFPRADFTCVQNKAGVGPLPRKKFHFKVAETPFF